MIGEQERVFIDVKVNAARSSGYYVRCPQLKQAIERIENNSDSKVVGIVYDGENSIELILDPPVYDACETGNNS
tara:strand:+ start:243 stop:464 length:222 start_codon:yes stop_codon:yes gene_type:complete